jgi:hypothetical protein
MYDQIVPSNRIADIGPAGSIASSLGTAARAQRRVLDLQLLRSRGLIELARNQLAILDKAGLSAIAEFDPQYLDGRKLAD